MRKLFIASLICCFAFGTKAQTISHQKAVPAPAAQAERNTEQPLADSAIKARKKTAKKTKTTTKKTTVVKRTSVTATPVKTK